MRLVAGRLLAAVAALCVSATVPSAQSPQSPTATSVPRVIRVTGTLPLATGPAAPVEIVTFAIYADETGGEPLWQETQHVTVDRDGQYAVLLGSTLPDGVPLDVFIAQDARWFGLHVERPGEPEPRRVLLASVPYALRASDADTLGGKPASAFLLAPDATTGTGGAATTGKRTASTTAGQGSTNGNEPGATAQDVVLAGTVNVLAKYVTAADVGPSAVSEVSGRVGINTGAALPADYLHIKFTDPFGAFTGLAVQNLSNNANAASGMLFYDHNGVLTQFQGFNNLNHAYVINNIAKNGANQFDGTYNFLIGGSSKFLVASNGNIGIGKASPTATLDVSGTVAVTNDQPATPLQVFSAYTGNTNNDPTTAPAVASFFGATSVGVTGPGAPPAGSRGVQTFGGNGGTFNFTGGTGGIGLHAIGGNGGNALNLGGDGGTAILAVGGDSGVGASIHGGDGGRGITAFGGAGGIDRVGGIGLYAVGGPAGQGLDGGAGAFIAAGTGGTTAAVLAGDVFVQNTGNLSINGNAFKPGGGSWSTLSDERTKKSIEPLRGALDRLLQLRGVTFEYSDPAGFHEQPGQHIGMVTQEVEKVFPTWVDTASDGYERLTFRGFEAVAVEAVRELDSSSKETAARVAELERQNADLRRAVEELSATLKAMQQK